MCLQNSLAIDSTPMSEQVDIKITVSVVIPTLDRSAILINTIEALLAQTIFAKQIIIIDQSKYHNPTHLEKLRNFERNANIIWIRQQNPSVVEAMNNGLKQAKSEYVLFLDDDIKPFPDLIESHLSFASTANCDLVAGRVIESWDDPAGLDSRNGGANSFNSIEDRNTTVFMGGNFMVRRESALTVGGFDESFKGTAHDYEREFSDRMIMCGATMKYCGSAAVHHLKEAQGGIRTHGHFLKTIKPHHAVGAYYYILRSRRIGNKALRIIKRMFQRVATRTHLKEPWWIPITLIGDVLGLCWAIYLRLRKPRLITQ